MKIISLEISNIGKIEHMLIPFDKPLNLFFGEIMQGKTTILNSVRYNCGGPFPNDILRHGTDSGFIMMRFNNSSIRREFYKGKDGVTRARPIQYVVDGRLMKKPADAIKKFLNPFLLDQDFFVKKSELERNRYFLELLDIDVTDLDRELKETEEAAKTMRITVQAYGEIKLDPVEKADVAALKEERQRIVSEAEVKEDEVRSKNEEIDKYNNEISLRIDSVDSRNEEIVDIRGEIEALKNRIKLLEGENTKDLAWISEHPRKDLLPIPPDPDTSSIDEKISDAKAQNVRYTQYLADKKRHDEKAAKEAELMELERKAREIRKEKIKRLADVSDNCKVPGLTFDEDAQAIYEGSSIGMISMSQIMRLSSALSDLYPKGFGLELLDRGESLGKSIYEYTERAKREDKTILATIVGERPAEVPEDVGVWVVSNGELK